VSTNINLFDFVPASQNCCTSLQTFESVYHVMLYSWMSGSRRTDGTYRTSGANDPATQRRIPEDLNTQKNCCVNLKPRNVKLCN